MVRGEVFELAAPRTAKGAEQRGRRFGVVVQADELLVLSTVLVAPTSRSANAQPFRPAITVGGQRTRVLLEQTTAVSLERLGRSLGVLSPDEQHLVDEALVLVLAL